MKRYFILLTALAAILASCHKEDNVVPVPKQPTIYEPIISTDVVPGVIRVKLKEDNTAALELLVAEDGSTSIRRTFPEDKRFEKRLRDEGMHLWYDIFFNPDIPVTKAAGDLRLNDKIAHIEYITKVKPTQASFKFNDPLFSLQWGFYNNGSKYQYEIGCDINLLPAWEITTGSRDVIVAVADDGLDYRHPDLRDNIWINEAELNGEAGVDDDNNGYVDDIFGYNFCIGATNEAVGTIAPGDHGCNVGGIIAAVNNNGIGYCGIAGGDGSSNGVRLMSCQMVGSSRGAYSANAIVYAANNGAVIINNSWGNAEGNDEVSQSLIDAINYFYKYAGLDENNNQVGPMAGGLIVFAAGNDNKGLAYPVSKLDNIIAVAALAPTFKKSSFSNYGSWINISAPGGEFSSPKGQIFNAGVSGDDDDYCGMQGTSQAAPHVSGTAALIVSKFGGPGFTVDMLKEILLKSAKPIDEYNETAHKGMLGVGIVDAYAALTLDTTEDPQMKIENVISSCISNAISLEIVASKGNNIFGYDIYYSKNSIKNLDLSLDLPEGVVKARVNKESVGDTTKWSVSGLDFNQTYYFRVAAYDRFNHHSDLTEEISQLAGINKKPTIIPLNGLAINIKAHETKSLKFKTNDEDRHPLSYYFEGGSKAASIKSEGDSIIFITFIGKSAPAGNYKAYLAVSDPYSSSDTLEISYTILENHAPVATNSISDIVFSTKSSSKTIDLSQFFKDEDGETLNYTVSISSTNGTPSTVKVADTSISGESLTINSANFGIAFVAVTATDFIGEQCTLSFMLLVRDGSQLIDIYPNPVVDFVNLRTSEEKNAAVSITSTTGATVYSDNVTIEPFNPTKIDIRHLSPGVYTINLTIDSKTVNKSIVKL